MTLESWRDNGWLRPHKTSKQEIAGILELVERDLADASRPEILRRGTPLASKYP